MPDRSRDKTFCKGRVVDLSAGGFRRRGGTEAPAFRPPRRRAASRWRGVGLLALVALAAIAGREGFDPLGVRDWLAGAGFQPIRAAVSVASGRADCRVTRVVDGDTVDLDCPEGFVRARLLGFDTPEVTSPECAAELALGAEATRALERRIRASGDMRVAFGGADRYGRRLARLILDGTDVAGPMIAEGLARPYGGGARRSWCR